MRNIMIIVFCLCAAMAMGQTPAQRNAMLRAFGFLGGEAAPVPTGLLDAYPNAAAMYSVGVLLRGAHTVTDATAGSETEGITAAYTVQLVRSSDNAIRSFTPAEIESGAALTWVGVDTGRVSIQYDQTGLENHATQTNNTFRPILVEADTLVRLNGKPAIRYSLHGMDMPFFYAVADTLTQFFSVYSLTLAGNAPYVWGSNPAARGLAHSHLSATRRPRIFTARSGTFIGESATALDLDRQYIYTNIANRVTLTTFRDGTADISVADGNSNYAAITNLRIGYTATLGADSGAFRGKFQAGVCYRVSVSRTGVETALNNHFNAY